MKTNKTEDMLVPVLLTAFAALLIMAIVSILLRFFYEKADEERYATKEWTIALLSNYREVTMTEEEQETIGEDLSRISEDYLIPNSDGFSEDDLRALYYYIDTSVSKSLSHIPKEEQEDLTAHLTESMLQHENPRLSTDERKDLEAELLLLREELSALKESLPGGTSSTTVLKSLTENDIRKIIENTGLSRETIKSWIKSADDNVIDALKKADSEILTKMQTEDETLRSGIRSNETELTRLSENLTQLDKDKMDLSKAEKELQDLNDAITLLRDSIASLPRDDGSDSLNKELTALQKELEKARDELQKEIDRCEDTLSDEMSENRKELLIELKKTKEASEQSLLKAYDTLSKLLTEYQNTSANNLREAKAALSSLIEENRKESEQNLGFAVDDLNESLTELNLQKASRDDLYELKNLLESDFGRRILGLIDQIGLKADQTALDDTNENLQTTKDDLETFEENAFVEYELQTDSEGNVTLILRPLT